jgi:hypothetical protein
MSGIAQKYMPNMENEGEPYYEKHFRQASGQDSDANTTNKSDAPYYEQHYKKFQPEKGNSAWDYASQVPAGIVAGARAAPRSLYEGVKGIAGLVGELNPVSLGKTGEYTKKGLEYLEEHSPEKFKELMNFLFPTFEETRKEIPEWLAPKAENFGQKVLQNASRFGTEGVLTGGVGSIPKQIGGSLGAATGQQIAEELELPPIAHAALTAGSAYFGHKVGGKLESPKTFFTPKQKITPEARSYFEASEALGIDPLATGQNPTQLQKVAQKWATHGHGGPQILEEAYKSRSGQISRVFNEAMDKIGDDLFSVPNKVTGQMQGSPVEAGSALQRGIEQAKNQVEHTKTQLYKAVDATIPEGDKVRLVPGDGIDAGNVNSKLIEVQSALKDTLTHEPAGSYTHKLISQAIDRLQKINERGQTNFILDSNGNPIPMNPTMEIGVKELENTKRALGEIIDWHIPGGAKSLLKPIYHQMGKTLDEYGNKNKAYGNSSKAAKEYFKDEVLNIRTNLLDAIKEGKKPEQALSKMNTVSGIRQVKKALKNLPDGDKLFNALARYYVKELIQDRIIDPSTGLMKIPKGAGNGIHNFLTKDKELYSLIHELLPAEQLKTLHQLEDVGKGLFKGFNALVNPSQTADTALAIYEILGPAKQFAKGVYNLPKIGGFLDIGAAGLKFFFPKFLAKMVTNPDFARKIYNTAKAADKQDWGLYNRLLLSVTDDLAEDNESTPNPEQQSNR